MKLHLLICSLLATTVLTQVSEANNSIASQNSDTPTTSHFEPSHFEQSVDSPPIVTIHFEPAKDNALHKNRLSSKGVFTDGKLIYAPAEDFIRYPEQSFTFPEIPINSNAKYYCHDQGLKPISHISIVPEPDKPAQPESITDFLPPVILRIINELNFNGTSTIDALLCHEINHGTINQQPDIAVLTLSKRTIKLLPRGMHSTKRNNGQPESHPIERAFLHFKNGSRIETLTPSLPDDYPALLTNIDEAITHNTSPFAHIYQANDQLILNGIFNNAKFIRDLPPHTDLPSYQSRYPFKSELWRLSSPVTGTIMHSVGIDHLPGAVAAGSSVLLASERLITGAFLGFVVTLFTDAVTVPQLLIAGTTLFLAQGFYRWGTSEY